MVDFTKLLGEDNFDKKLNPIEIYDSLDRTSETSELRKSQLSILQEWWKNRQNDKDIILKLHTGQGKTLIGLLILQSKINEYGQSCIYVCPNKYLVEQTCEQAKKFGIAYTTFDGEVGFPDDFINGKKILITHVQKVFNGLTIFGTGNNSREVSAMILDDSHACIESIKSSYTIKLKNDHKVYKEILELFEEELKSQGSGRYFEIVNGENTSVLSIPYWSWVDNYEHLTEMLNRHKDEDEIKFAWALIKDDIKNCQCFISGHELQIIPYINQVNKFGTFSKAGQRIFMSATTQNDSFFINGLGVKAEAVKNPLTFNSEKWSGEKMVLIPSLVHYELDREQIITKFAPSNSSRKSGVVALTNSFRKSDIYKQQGAVLAEGDKLGDYVKNLKRGNVQKTFVIANRYDGIDLPDDSCRILIIDSKPYSEALDEKYEEYARAKSDLINIRVAQKIEQGLGRSVRGEKDYSVIILIGDDLIKFIGSTQSKGYFSNQTQKQIEIGKKVCDSAREELSEEQSHFSVISKVIMQSLERDEGWKRYYSSKMNTIENDIPNTALIELLELERQAESYFARGMLEQAFDSIQKIIDKVDSEEEKGWYLQVLARYKYFISKSEALKFQQTAFRRNTSLLKPKEGVSYSKISFIDENRITKIKNWIFNDDFTETILTVDEILDRFSFGIEADKFEKSVQEIGEMLGFKSQRPEKDFKEGPDNLWCIGSNEYFLIECKNEVLSTRKDIIPSEITQMDKYCTWFRGRYPSAVVKNIMIIPTLNVTDKAFFTDEVWIMRKNTLISFKKSIKGFIKEFKNYMINELSDEKIQGWLGLHKLDNESLKKLYFEKPKPRR